jgi:nucleoside recognition membrane protein YjiH
MAAPTTPSSPPPIDRDWTAQAVDTVESIVLGVKAKTTVLTTVVKAIVYGLVIAALGAVALTALVIGLIRVADVYLLGWAGRVDGHHRLWIAYLALGMIFTLVGFICWSRRTAKEKR